MIRLTTQHPQSKLGLPVFVWSHGDAVLSHAEGITSICHDLGLTSRGLAAELGYSRRTIEGWRQGNPIGREALYKIMEWLSR